jgi:amino acid transporter
LIFVLFTYGGWNEMAYVAAEVKDPRRNIVRALVVGTAAVIALYLLVNVAFLYTLGYKGLAGSEAVASKAIGTVFPVVGSRLISVLVCISALGAVNGLIFTGARISYAVGEDHRIFRALGRWDPRTGTPVWALAVQGLIALALILAFGSYIDAILYTAAAVYAFYLGTSLSVIVLRFKEPSVERPYRVTGYPITPLIFSGVCLFLIYSSINYARAVKPVSLIVLAVALGLGVVVYVVTGLLGMNPVGEKTAQEPGVFSSDLQ